MWPPSTSATCVSGESSRPSQETAGQVPEPWEGWVRIIVRIPLHSHEWSSCFIDSLRIVSCFFLKKTLFHDQLSFILQEDGPTRRVGWGRFPGFSKAAKTVYGYTSMTNFQCFSWIHTIHMHSYVTCVCVCVTCVFCWFPHLETQEHVYMLQIIWFLRLAFSRSVMRGNHWDLGLWGHLSNTLWKIAFLLGRGWFSGANC